MLQYITIGVLIEINVMNFVTHKVDITIDCHISKLDIITYRGCYIVYTHSTVISPRWFHNELYTKIRGIDFQERSEM